MDRSTGSVDRLVAWSWPLVSALGLQQSEFLSFISVENAAARESGSPSMLLVDTFVLAFERDGKLHVHQVTQYNLTANPPDVMLQLEDGSSLRVADIAPVSYDNLPPDEQIRMLIALSWRLRKAQQVPKVMTEQQVLDTMLCILVCSQLASGQLPAHIPLRQLLHHAWQQHQQGPLLRSVQQLPTFDAATFNAAADAHTDAPSLPVRPSYAAPKPAPSGATSYLSHYTQQQPAPIMNPTAPSSAPDWRAPPRPAAIHPSSAPAELPYLTNRPTSDYALAATMPQSGLDTAGYDAAATTHHTNGDHPPQPQPSSRATRDTHDMGDPARELRHRHSRDEEEQRTHSGRSRSRSRGRPARSAADHDTRPPRSRRSRSRGPSPHRLRSRRARSRSRSPVGRTLHPDPTPDAGAPLSPSASGAAAFHSAVQALDESNLQSRLLKQALLCLKINKPRFYTSLSLRNLEHLQQVQCEHALLSLCHIIRFDDARIKNPAAYLTTVTKSIEQGFSVRDKMELRLAVELWEQVASGAYQRDVPAFVKVWYTNDERVKMWLWDQYKGGRSKQGSRFGPWDLAQAAQKGGADKVLAEVQRRWDALA